MSVQVENLEKSMAKLTIEVSAEQFEAAMQKAYIKNKGRIQLPGFRKGKAPRAMIEKMYGAGIFYEDAANEIIPEAYEEAAKESGLVITSQPEIDVTQIEKGKSFIFTATVAVKPEVTLGEYKGLEYEAQPVEVTDEEVEEELKKVQNQQARTVTVEDRPVADGDIVTIDYNADIRWEQVLEVERQANRYIWEDHPCRVTFPSPAEREALPYRSKKALTGAVRLTEFPGADLCACCGTHVSGSGQVGLVKFLSCQKLREGVRLELVCGGRAMAHLCRSWQQNRSIGQQLSVKPGDTSAAVERQGREVLSLKARCAGLEEELFRLLAEQYRDAGEVLLVRHDLAGDGARRLCDAVSHTCGGRCAVFSGEGERYQYAVIHPGADLREFVKHMNDALHGRGGGRSGFAQGSVAADEETIRAFFCGV